MATKRKKPVVHRAPVDQDAATELVLYIENTSDLSLDGPSGQGRSILLNLLRKYRKGTYDPKLAVRLLEYLTESGAKRYAKEMGSSEKEWSTMFNPATRHEAARQLEESFHSSAVNGEYDHVDTRIGARESSPRARVPITRIVIQKGDPDLIRQGASKQAARNNWVAKAYDSNGHLRSGVDSPDLEYVKRKIEEWWPGVPVEYKDAPAGVGESHVDARKETRLDKLRASLPPGYTIETYSPGDGVTRYRFFKNAPPKQSYFGPNNGVYTALGYKEAEAFAQGLMNEGTLHEGGQRMDTFTRSYFETALWSSTDNSNDQGGDPLDANYSVSDIAPETRDKMIADCESFQEKYSELLGDAPIDLGRAGHNFWLSRNGHGAGFFDDNLDELQKAAESYGTFDLYVGDDGQIHGYGSGGHLNEASTTTKAKYTRAQSPSGGLRDDVFRDGVKIGHITGPIARRRGGSSDYYSWSLDSISKHEAPPFGMSGTIGTSKSRELAFKAIIKADERRRARHAEHFPGNAPTGAKAAGREYAQDQVQGEHFMDWVRDQLLEASKMPPDKVLPLETKDQAKRIAANMLQQLGWDIQRNVRRNDLPPEHADNSDEYFAGIGEYLHDPKVVDWLADELLEIKSEMKGAVEVNEAAKPGRRARSQTPARAKGRPRARRSH